MLKKVIFLCMVCASVSKAEEMGTKTAINSDFLPQENKDPVAGTENSPVAPQQVKNDISSAYQGTITAESIRKVFQENPGLFLELMKSAMDAEEARKKEEHTQKNAQVLSMFETLRPSLEHAFPSEFILGKGPHRIYMVIAPECSYCKILLEKIVSLSEKEREPYSFYIIMNTQENNVGDAILAKLLIAAIHSDKLKQCLEAKKTYVNRLEKKNAEEIAQSLGINLQPYFAYNNGIDSELTRFRNDFNFVHGFPLIFYPNEKGEYAMQQGLPEDVRKIMIIPAVSPSSAK